MGRYNMETLSALPVLCQGGRNLVTWLDNDMKTVVALLALCDGKLMIYGGIPFKKSH